MARNNRELSQLGAFVSIVDNSQEIDAGTFDEEIVPRHLISIGSTLDTGHLKAPSVGIGTTFGGTTPDGMVIALPFDTVIAKSPEDAQGGSLAVDNGLSVLGRGEIHGELQLFAGDGVGGGGVNVGGANTTALNVKYGKANFGGNVSISTEGNEHSVGLGTTNITVSLQNANVAIQSGQIPSNRVECELSLYLSEQDGVARTQQFGFDQVPMLDVVGMSSFAGPMTIRSGATAAIDNTPTDPDGGGMRINSGIGIRGTIYQGGGAVTVDNLSIGTAAGGYIVIPPEAGDLAFRNYNGTLLEGPLQLLDGAYLDGGTGIATIGYSVYLSNTNNDTGWNPGIGDTVGDGAVSIVSQGSAFIEGSVRLAKDPILPATVHVGGALTTGNLTVYGIGEFGITELLSPIISLGNTEGTPDDHILLKTRVKTNILPFTTDEHSLGSENYRWNEGWIKDFRSDGIEVDTSSILRGNTTIEDDLNITATLNYNSADPAAFNSPINAAGVSSFTSAFIDNLVVGDDIVGTSGTALRAKRIDIGAAVTGVYYPIVLSQSGGDNTEVSLQADTQTDPFAYDPVNNLLQVPGDLHLDGNDGTDLGDINIKSNSARTKLNFFTTNVTNAELLTDGVRSLSIGSTLGVSTIKSYEHQILGSISIGRIGFTTASIKSVNGLENITITGNTLTEFSNDIAMDGDTFDVRNGTFNLCNSNSTDVTAFALGDNIIIGADSIGVTSIRNATTRIGGVIRIDGNVIQDDTGSNNIELISGANPSTRFAGDIQVDGNDIRVAGGTTNITMVTDIKTRFAGDIEVGGNEIRNSDGDLNISLLGDGLTSIGGTLRVGASQIQAGTGVTNITLTTNYVQIEHDLRINGNNIRADDNTTNITLRSDTHTLFTGNIVVGGNVIETSDELTAISLSAGSGSVGIASDLTVQNDLIVKGSETDIKSDNVRIKDRLVSIGLTIGTGTGSLVVPSLDENKDVGLLLNYYNTSAKKAAVFWDDSEGNVGIASDVTETEEVLTINQYAKIAVKSIAISDCAGTSDIIECEGSTRTLANITIDGGEY